MERSRLQRAALRWGGLALVAELWVALVFVHTARRHWNLYSAQMVSFDESMNRISQLKPLLFKAPYCLVYLILFVVGVSGVVGWLIASGMREAMAEEPDDQ